MRVSEYTIGEEKVVLEIEGNTSWGENSLLLSEDDDLTAGKPWHADGFTVASFLPSHEAELKGAITARIRDLLVSAGASLPGSEFDLETYHQWVDDERHATVVRGIQKGITLAQFPVDVRLAEQRLSEICGVPVTARNIAFGLDTYSLRIVRPGPTDNNPPHRDVWLDRLRHGINIYVPIAGSSPESSLGIVPGSHRWKESEVERTVAGAQVNGLPYTVPAVVGARRPLKLIRPSPAPGEALVFSPYLIHGGAVNFGRVTRVSIEMRFWRVDGPTRRSTEGGK